MWLKDPRKYCAACGVRYLKNHPCCSERKIIDNFQAVCLVKEQNERKRYTRKNVFASNSDKNIRMAISMPEKLSNELEAFWMSHYKEKLFKNHDEMYDFMREFPVFCIPERI